MGQQVTLEEDVQQLLDFWKFPWPLMEVLIGGRSSIDLPELTVEDCADAHEFGMAYGYDCDDPADRKLLHAVLVEALHFIQTQLMPIEWHKRNMKPPGEVLLCSDPRQLLVWASRDKKENRWRGAWACAVLRVVHTILHIDGITRLADVGIAREQIMGRFEKSLFRKKDGSLWLGEGSQSILLERVDWKLGKSRNSVILKLLHKPANVAETIYDILGVRIITQNPADVMIAVKFLRQFYLVTFANTHPSRVRNSLVDLGFFREGLENLRDRLSNGSLSLEGFLSQIEKMQLPLPRRIRSSGNVHTAHSYKSIQLTGRQLVRYPDPAYGWADKVSSFLRHCPRQHENPLLSQVTNWARKWQDNEKRREIRVFFPYEVQIMDRSTWLAVQSGEASHDHYKRSQVRAARRRVLAEVLKIGRAQRKQGRMRKKNQETQSSN